MSVLLTIAALLVSGAAAFVFLPKPAGTRAPGGG
jgi:hypothetical protein